MATQVPRLYLLYGDDPLAISDALKGMAAKLGDASATALDAQRLPAANLDLGTLEQIVSAQPFLSSRRLIIIPDAERLPSETSFRERFYRLLQSLPETCALVLIEQHDLGTAKQVERYQKASPWFGWSAAHPDVAYIRKFERPRGPRFHSWIESQCAKLGGAIDAEAAQLLADYVDQDPSVADQELRKLLDYVDRSRPITSEDVERLTPMGGHADIFAMVDALGLRRRAEALELLHRLIRDREPPFVFAMIVRQFRLLLQAREAIEVGERPIDSLKVHPFVAGKIAEQARNFQLRELEAIYQQLMQLDLAVKTGKADLALNLEGVIAAIAV